jgi:hypothetical protein
MVSSWKVDIKDTLSADTTNIFCSSDKKDEASAAQVCKAEPDANEQHMSVTKMILKYVGSENGIEELDALLDSMLRSGVTADRSKSTEKNKKMMTQISQLGPQTPARCGKRTATSMDVDSLEKAMRRTAARNLDDVGIF